MGPVGGCPASLCANLPLQQLLADAVSTLVNELWSIFIYFPHIFPTFSHSLVQCLCLFWTFCRPRRIYASAFFPSSISAPPLFRFDFLASWKVVKRCSRNFKQPLSQLFLLLSFLRCSAGFSLLPFLSILLPSSGKCAVNFKLVFLGRAELLT